MSNEAMKLALEALKDLQLCTDDYYESSHEASKKADKAITAIKEALAKQEQGEPVAIVHRNEYNEYRLEPHDSFDIESIPFNVDVPLYTKQRMTLTNEEIMAEHLETDVETYRKFKEWQAAHGIKENT
jgi:hypothetical protein